jgi:hypothetical protein
MATPRRLLNSINSLRRDIRQQITVFEAPNSSGRHRPNRAQDAPANDGTANYLRAEVI